MTKNDEKPVVNFYRAEKKPAPSSVADSDLQGKLDRLQQEHDNNVRSMNDIGAQLTAMTAERDELQKQVDSLTRERDAAQKALADGKIIPADALKRITDVKGVGEKLAPEILAALTGK